MIYENVVLQDFSTEAWKKFDLSDLSLALVKFLQIPEQNRIGELGYTVGETLDILMTKASHTILTARIEDNKIMGDVMFHRSKKGKEAMELYEMGRYKFTVRGMANENKLVKILTFDMVSINPTSIRLIEN